MRTARLADGRTLQFPDGTPDQVIQDTVRRMVQGETPQAPQAAPAQPEQGADFEVGALRSLASGVSAGFGDEIEAFFRTLNAPPTAPFRERLSTSLDEIRAEQEQFAQENPKTAFGLEVAGGLTTGGVGASRAAAAKVFQGAVTRGGQIAQRVGSTAAAGVPAGAAFGAGTAEGGIVDRVQGAATGAVVGGVGGAVLRPLIAGGTALLRLGGNTVRGITRALTKTENDVANAQIAKSLVRDDAVSTVRQSLDDLGQGATIADSAGEATKILTERVAGTPASRNVVVQRITERLDGSRDRIASDVRETFTPGNLTFDETVKGITKQASEEAAPLYAQAYASVVNNSTPAMKELLKNPRIQKAIPKALERIKSKTVQAGDPDEAAIRAIQDDAGDSLTDPSMIVWDHVKRVLSDEQFKAFSKNPSLARDIGKNVKQLTGVLDKQVPAYGQARKIWAGSKEAEDAFNAGTEVLDGLTSLKTGAKASVALFDELSDAGKQLYRTGVGQDIENKILTTADDTTASLVSRIAGNPAKRKVLENAIPDAAERGAFTKSLLAQRDFTKNSNEILKNSRVAIRRSLKDEDSASIRTVLSNLIAGQFALSGNQFAQLRLVSNLAGKAGGLSDEANRLIGRKLTETRGAEILKTLNAVDRLSRLPPSLREATKLSPSDVVKFFLDNPTATRKFNETASAVTAAVASDKRSRER